MIKLTRQRCTFSIHPDNRIMLMEILSLSSQLEEELDLAEVINSALKNYLPSTLTSLHRITMDEELAEVNAMIKKLDSEFHGNASL